MSKIILIGGSPTAGKSYTARKLAEEFKLPWIPTDTIRSQMRAVVRKEDYPTLFDHAAYGADVAVEYLTHKTAEEIVAHQNKESEDVWKGVVGIINGAYDWDNFIIEGIAILPKLIAAEKWGAEKDIKPVFLIDENMERVRNSIFTRGLWDDPEKYPDEVKEKEVKWVFAFSAYIKREAEKYGFPVISVDRSSYIEEVKKAVKLQAVST